MKPEELRALIRELMTEGMNDLRSEMDEKLRAPVTNLGDLIRSGTGVAVAEKKKADLGLDAARAIRCFAATKGNSEKAVKLAKEWYGFGDDAPVVKTLLASDNALGGTLISPTDSNEIIELLRSETAFRRMNPTPWPMPTGTARIRKIASGGSAHYIGETQPIRVTSMEFGWLTLNWKKLAAIVPISNDLLRYNSPSADSIVRDDLVSAIQEREDTAFIRGDGTANTPKGLRNLVLASMTFAANGTFNLGNVTADLAQMILLMQQAKIRFRRPGWMMSHRTAMALRILRDGNGNFAFKEEMDRGMLFGFPYATTHTIPDTLGGDGDESELYLADFAEVLLGESLSMVFDMSDEAAYVDTDNSNAIVSAFSQDETVIKVIEEHDMGLRHDAAVVVLTAVTWGVT